MKYFVPLECNPEVLTPLAHNLGLSKNLEFRDVYNISEPFPDQPEADDFFQLPRPCAALLFIYEMTKASQEAFRVEEAEIWGAYESEDVEAEYPALAYKGYGSDEPAVWYKQTIGHACGLIGTLHCMANLNVNSDSNESREQNASTSNGQGASPYIVPNSLFDKLLREGTPLPPKERAQMLYDSTELEAAHAAAAVHGDTAPPENPETWDDPYAYVAFVKGKDGCLWELEGRRKGPVKRGHLGFGAGSDLLSEEALNLGPRAIIQRAQRDGGGIGFHCIALGPSQGQ